MKIPFWIEGLVAAVFTPMHDDGSLNISKISVIVEQLIEDEVSAFYVCGSTGEAPSLTREERQVVAEAYVSATAGRLPVIIQVGHDSLAEACRMAEHAQSIGASAISAVPPVYYGIDSVKCLIESLKEIAAGAPNLPLYYYHIPRLTAVRIDLIEFLETVSEVIPMLNGVKYSDFKVFELQACSSLQNGRFNMLFGSDEMLLSGLVGGAQGAVGTTYNFATPLYNRIIAAFETGNLTKAQNLQGLSVRLLQAINRYRTATTNLPGMKAMMGLIGLECGPLRLPLPSLSTSEVLALRRELHSIGFFEWGR